MSDPQSLKPRPRRARAPSDHRSSRFDPRRGGRVVECVALEMRSTGNCTGGSNPSLSAIVL